jgi:hypothetical protein
MPSNGEYELIIFLATHGSSGRDLNGNSVTLFHKMRRQGRWETSIRETSKPYMALG